ncbi:unnamed protein product [Leptidea sinapis]|uniref:Amidase domain-containing protein n=1 Tax=Leptidea sinapis TaxID=189913 RepID=A0A5E4QBK6_9NEOP|nr:unnamed protein product [Leptidea sinapis]
MSVCKTILAYFRLFFDKLIDFIFALYWDDKKEIIPDLDKEHAMLAESAVTLARKIKQKELKSEELVKAVIERIKLVNPIVNAITTARYEEALEDAREVDRQISQGLSEEQAKKPFLGVPFTTKESQAIKGMPMTLGTLTKKNEVAVEDSEAVVLMKKAGAIPLAATNLPELLIWQETRNPVYGMTLNPHHTGRSPGGSSGAEAALTATYATPISLCSDIGGSTRMPAFYCGMFGHHPTAGSTDTTGVLFRKGNDESSMFTLGFISKHVEDLAPLTKVIAGDKGKLMKLDSQRNIKDLKFYYLEGSDDCLICPLRSEMTQAMDRVIKNLKSKLNVEVLPYRHEGFNNMYQLWAYWMSKEPEKYSKIATNGKGEADGWMELLKKMVGMSQYYLFSIMRFIEEKHITRLVDAKWAEEVTNSMKTDLRNKLGDNGVLLLPSAPQAAPYHYSCYLRPFNFGFFGIVNVLKCPATQVPLGTNGQGLPIGIQVLSTPYNDALCLEVAKYLEKEFSGSIMACKVKQK